MEVKSSLQKVGWGLLALAVAAGIGFCWLMVLRFLFKKRGSRPCPYALAWLVENPIRRWYMSQVVDRVGIRPGELVLELGPGPGTFTVKAALRAEPGGRLVSVDIQPKMIAAVEKKVRAAGLTNVETQVASAYNLPLDDESVDRAFLVTVLQEIPDRQQAFAELRRVLKPEGILSITEELLDPNYRPVRTTICWAEEAGFELVERLSNGWTYTLNLQKRAG